MEITLLFVLIFINGIFALSEMSVVAANKRRLQQDADLGKYGAHRALALANNPTRFLSTVQAGITAVMVMSGAFGDDLFAQPLEQWLHNIPLFSPYAKALSIAGAVGITTFLFLFLGELIPKRIALLNPELFASLLAPAMHKVAALFLPIVFVLTRATEAVLRLFGVKERTEPVVTEEEIRVLMEQGAEAGVLENEEHAIVNRVFNLDDQSIRAILTPRLDIVFLDTLATDETNRSLVLNSSHSFFPVCTGALDNLKGIVSARELVRLMLAGGPLNLADNVEKALFVPETLNVMELLQTFKAHNQLFALVVDEHGELQGLVTMHDVLEAMVGDVSGPVDDDERDIVTLQDGTHLVDGAISVARLHELTTVSSPFEGEEEGEYHTAGGLVMARLARIPREGDVVEDAGWRFEVIDMDNHRVGKLRITAVVPTF